MYIPITKTEEKCAGQLSYGFVNLDKLGGFYPKFQNHPTTMTFFKIDPHNDGPRGYF